MGDDVDSQGCKSMKHAQPTREYGGRLGVQCLDEDVENLPGGIGGYGRSVSYNVAPGFTFRYDVDTNGYRLLADEKSVAGKDEKTAILSWYFIHCQTHEELVESLTRYYTAWRYTMQMDRFWSPSLCPTLACDRQLVLEKHSRVDGPGETQEYKQPLT